MSKFKVRPTERLTLVGCSVQIIKPDTRLASRVSDVVGGAIVRHLVKRRAYRVLSECNLPIGNVTPKSHLVLFVAQHRHVVQMFTPLLGDGSVCRCCMVRFKRYKRNGSVAFLWFFPTMRIMHISHLTVSRSFGVTLSTIYARKGKSTT